MYLRPSRPPLPLELCFSFLDGISTPVPYYGGAYELNLVPHWIPWAYELFVENSALERLCHVHACGCFGKGSSSIMARKDQAEGSRGSNHALANCSDPNWVEGASMPRGATREALAA